MIEEKTIFVFRSLSDYFYASKKKPKLQNPYLTIGNFESVHLGHQALLQSLVNKNNKARVLISFDPTASAYFRQQFEKIYGTKQKIELLSPYLEAIILLKFNKKLANQSAEDFLQAIDDYINPSHISIGDDFCYGKNRTGNAASIKKFCQKKQLSFYQLKTIQNQNKRLSSSVMRNHLFNYQFNQIKNITTRNYCLSGRVKKGRQLARKMGYPTANIPLNFKPVISGVFAVWAYLCDKQGQKLKIAAVANLGTKPTIVNEQKFFLEVHLLIKNSDEKFGYLYQKNLQVEFVHFIRKEQKFASLEQLKDQIKKDSIKAKSFLNQI